MTKKKAQIIIKKNTIISPPKILEFRPLTPQSF